MALTGTLPPATIFPSGCSNRSLKLPFVMELVAMPSPLNVASSVPSRLYRNMAEAGLPPATTCVVETWRSQASIRWCYQNAALCKGGLLYGTIVTNR